MTPGRYNGDFAGGILNKIVMTTNESDDRYVSSGGARHVQVLV
eukprot:CAMPEP_0172572176 /NCGR_PEP_ID=MMETSP1067-20121228/134198_1 /TAXON_ID=265564 ORGANISM="Thalassiosira punctigera, Strain Tpunct2005C2" /NCGR_SAMPLE_ID=MMETSP1067 /ASSEMBLY_ACC=CAM_ASM_000444 /LENGTH=42 /DNA_ID= /DNA_START= /DNA_END= /DNA_ORIENTATION=